MNTEEIKEKIMQQLVDKYKVVIGHPSGNRNMLYYSVERKEGTNERGDLEWVMKLLKEIGFEYTTELCSLTISVRNQFIVDIRKKVSM